MHVNKNSLFLGHPVPLIRKAFRELVHGYADEIFFSNHLGINKAKAAILINRLIESGYLERGKFHGYKNHVSLTIKGHSLRMASFASPIKRKTADKKIAELIERARFVNISNNHLYKVIRIAVFGSYLTKKERINDIDVDIILKRKFNEEIQRKKEDACIKRALNKGKKFGNLTEELFYPMYRTQKFLKNRSRAFSLHYGDKILERTKYKIVYEFKE